MTEKLAQPSEFEEEDIIERPDIQLKASVTYNRENNRFDINEDEFWGIDAEADEETKGRVRENFARAEHAMSMEFEPSGGRILPLPSSELQEADTDIEPINSYSTVQR